MHDILLLKGLSIGFAIAAPVGPIGILCIRRTIANGTLSGFASGVGAATADSFYGAVAAFSLTAISGFLYKYNFYINLVGALFLLLMGIKIFREKNRVLESLPDRVKIKHGMMALAKDFGSTLVLTLTNPATIIAFVAIFSGLGFVETEDTGYVRPLSMVIGVFFGSLTWWLLLSSCIGFFQYRINENILKYTHIISGCLIAGFGLGMLVRLIFERL